MSNRHIVTAESVRRGHPDKACDQIADAILDAHLEQDPNAHVAVEVFATDGKILVAGEVTSKAKVNYKEIVWRVLRAIRYKRADLSSAPDKHLDIEVRVHEQSTDIAAAVDREELGAGDQGIMVGYATNETEEFLPLPVVLAHRICRELDELSRGAKWLSADGKAQVSVVYDGDTPLYVKTVVISAQHTPNVCRSCMEKAILESVVFPTIPDELLRPKTDILINSSGQFVLGGPAADTGLTGRKLAVDQYGPVARIGGGALSGKDATKVDRSGAYMARYIAKNLVAVGLAERCEVQIAYAIGQAEPVSVSVDALGTGVIANGLLTQTVRKVFDLRLAAIIKAFDLRKPRFSRLAAYGHYGRPELNLPWERMDKADALFNEAKRLLLG
ncbi:MAG: methionine adenosyltransferase [Clostridia bacterium]